MERYSYKHRSYALWVERDVIELDEEELFNSFMNIKIYIDDDEGIGLNVWTVNYLKSKLDTFIESQNELLLLPDIVVKNLYRDNIKKAVEEYIDEIG